MNKLTAHAENISRGNRQKILSDMSETSLHKHLKELFQRMQPNYTVEVTHGSAELGKDLVLVSRDSFGTTVIGVVVKSGDISGKTRGEVDVLKSAVIGIKSAKTPRMLAEVESQVQQARAHPAELKTIFSKLPVTKVMVILAGQLSNSARTRLERELSLSPSEIRDIEWLIDNFTLHYPEVFFDSQVMDFVQQKLNSLEKKSFGSKKGIALSKCFIEPMVAVRNEEPKSLKELVNPHQRMALSQIRASLTPQSKIMIVGDPGTGKSAALAKMAIDIFKHVMNELLANRKNTEKIELPVLVHAKDVLASNSVDELLKRYYGDPSLLQRFSPMGLLVDGVDEVTVDVRRTVLEKAAEFAGVIGAGLIITSRKIDVVEAGLPTFERYELLNFEISQALLFFEKISSDGKVVATLKEGLKKIEGRIPLIPLSLMFLVDLVEERREIPASVTELYDRYYDIALGRYDKEKGIEVLFEYHIKKSFLSALAYKEFLLKNRLDIPMSDYRRFCKTYGEEYEWDNRNVGEFASEIERAGVLLLREPVRFRHRSILDYFAAHYIFDKRAEIDGLTPFLVELYFGGLWQEVVFFYIGLRREISLDIIDSLFARRDKNFLGPLNKFMAGRLLQAGWNTRARIKKNGLSKVINAAPIARSSIKDLADREGLELPGIFVDLMITELADQSLGSVFVHQQAVQLLKALRGKNSPENILKKLCLLVSHSRFMNPEIVRIGCEEIASNLGGLNTQDQASTLVLLMFVEKKNPAIYSSMKHRLKKLLKKSPDAIKKLLPRVG